MISISRICPILFLRESVIREYLSAN